MDNELDWIKPAEFKKLQSAAQSPAWDQSLVEYSRVQYCDQYISTSLLMTWKMGWSTTLVHLQMIQNWEEWLVYQMSLLFRGTLRGWSNGPVVTSWTSSMGNVKPCHIHIVGLRHEERMRELGLFRVKKGRLRGILSIHINTTWWKKLRRTEMDSAQ